LRAVPDGACLELFQILTNPVSGLSCLPEMEQAPANRTKERLSRELAGRGFRFTPQREHVYNVLLRKRDHPTAEELFLRAKREMPDISMATVYNCLDALVRCGVARQVSLARGPSRFCSNMADHCHFYCDECAKVYDIEAVPEVGIRLPAGYESHHLDIAIHGRCPACAQRGGARQDRIAKS